MPDAIKNPFHLLPVSEERGAATERTRLKRKNKKEIRPIVLGDRDFEILRILYEYKFADSQMIFELLGDHCRDPQERGKHHKLGILKRLRMLFDHGLVQRPATQVFETYQLTRGPEKARKTHYAGSEAVVYSLGDKGLLTLGARLKADLSSFISLFKNDRYRSQHFIKHTLMRNRFRAAIELATRKRFNVDLQTWKDMQIELADSVSFQIKNSQGDPEDKAFALIPDDFFTLKAGEKRRHFLVEAELTPKNRTRTKQKMRLYYEYCIRQKKIAEEKYKLTPNDGLQVLYLAPSWERRNNLRDIAIEADPRGKGSSLFLFVSVSDFDYRQDPERVFDPIWLPGKRADLFDQSGEAYEWMSLLG
jgi:hypothetical protein